VIVRKLEVCICLLTHICVVKSERHSVFKLEYLCVGKSDRRNVRKRKSILFYLRDSGCVRV